MNGFFLLAKKENALLAMKVVGSESLRLWRWKVVEAF